MRNFLSGAILIFSLLLGLFGIGTYLRVIPSSTTGTIVSMTEYAGNDADKDLVVVARYVVRAHEYSITKRYSFRHHRNAYDEMRASGQTNNTHEIYYPIFSPAYGDLFAANSIFNLILLLPALMVSAILLFSSLYGLANASSQRRNITAFRQVTFYAYLLALALPFGIVECLRELKYLNPNSIGLFELIGELAMLPLTFAGARRFISYINGYFL